MQAESSTRAVPFFKVDLDNEYIDKQRIIFKINQIKVLAIM
ncbi:hypothetical protein Bateq7PJ16_3674 [Bacillus subtilis]|nr:hypothetical protein B4143_4020 [Bacillus subtilis]QHF59480.1 hypothetical protein Bateq7PJ16_3674 [Bacillus subtilis]RPK04409.1 hypothetical protein EH11_00814 [Bacillus subtilis]RUS10081.1 hypothetical protein EFW59_00813 [Bacillus subtilis]CCU60422.1 hypothetical protein BSUBE1_3791 [Bacillus subtilis E1]